jgi:glutamate racemase
VLGCTHYPLLTGAISRAAGDNIKIVDSAGNCAAAVKDLLDRQSLSAGSNDTGNLQVALTDAPDHFLRVAREALALDLGNVQIREILSGAPTL